MSERTTLKRIKELTEIDTMNFYNFPWVEDAEELFWFCDVNGNITRLWFGLESHRYYRTYSTGNTCPGSVSYRVRKSLGDREKAIVRDFESVKLIDHKEVSGNDVYRFEGSDGQYFDLVNRVGSWEVLC